MTENDPLTVFHRCPSWRIPASDPEGTSMTHRTYPPKPPTPAGVDRPNRNEVNNDQAPTADRDRRDAGARRGSPARRPGVGRLAVGLAPTDGAPGFAGPGATRRILRTCYAILAGFLLMFAFALSFGALRHRAVEAEIIHGDLATVLWGGLSVHTQAGIWALCPDVLAVVGIIGIRLDRRDLRAWAALLLGLGLTLTFQVWADPWVPLLRAVPAVAGAMAVWMLEVPWTRTRKPDPIPDPVPAPKLPPRVDADMAVIPKPASARGREPRTGTLTKADRQALYRAGNDPVKVERVVAKRNLDRSVVAGRWPLPSRNGDHS